MRRQWTGLAEGGVTGGGGGGELQVNHAQRIGRASATICRCQSVLSCKYRKIWKLIYSLFNSY